MIEVKIKNISITDIGFVVFLKGPESEKVLPIFIGPVEAQAISMVLMKNAPKRPMTHDLLKTILDHSHLKINKVCITSMKNETYFAELQLQKEGLLHKLNDKPILVDCRPSDGIALALKYEAPILLEQSLMEHHGIIIQDTEGDEDTESESIKKHQGITKKANEQLGQYQKQLEDAVQEDRFEDAAKLRDKIDSLIGKLN